MSLLGRFQPGQSVTIGIATVDSGGNPVVPDSAPVATIKDASNNVLFSGKLAMSGPSGMSFSLPIYIGVPYSLGTYTVTYTYSVGTFTGGGSDTFSVIGGGDIGGRILSMYAYARPEATYVVAQLTSGNLVQGRNPRLQS